MFGDDARNELEVPLLLLVVCNKSFTRVSSCRIFFLLAVPTMLAVTVYSIFLKKFNYLGVEQKGYEMLYARPEFKIIFTGKRDSICCSRNCD